MSVFSQLRRALTLTSPLGDSVIATAVNGQEALNGLFEFEVTIQATRTDITAQEIVGQTVTINLNANGDTPRTIHGFVRSLQQGDQSEGGLRRYMLTVVPGLWLLSQNQHHRIWENKNVLDIISDLVSPLASIQSLDDSKLSANDYPKRALCIQYGESDFEFLSRLLAQDGINYYFEHSDGKHTLVLADAAGHFFASDADALWSGVVKGHQRQNSLFSWSDDIAFHTGQVSLCDYNEHTPTNKHQAQARTVTDLPNIGLCQSELVFGYPRETGDDGKTNFTPKHKTRRAERLMEAWESSACVSHAQSNCPNLLPGAKFQKKDISGAAQGEFLVTRIEHRASDCQDAGMVYSNQFTCQSAKIAPRPQATGFRPSILGTQTATVKEVRATASGQDKLAQVRIQFHWAATHATCWVRVGQLMAGNKWGSYFVPDVGQEVIVTFVDGDPDRPLITGVLYNANQVAPPYTKTQCGIRTRSADYNELRFDDKAGEEEVYLEAGKDFNVLVHNDQVSDVENDQRLTVKNNQEINVTKARTVTVSEGDEKISLSKGNREVDVGGKHTMNAKQAMTFTSKQKIELKVGGSTLTMTNTGIEMKMGANSVKVDAKGVTVAGTLLKLDGKAMTEVKGGGMVKVQGGVTMIN